MTQHYFTERGDWGLMEYLEEGTLGWIAVPTGSWTPDMFQVLDECLNAERFGLAKHFNVGVHTIFAGKCQVCKLSIDQVNGQAVVEENH